jgi:prepilin-type N-terminal cleavage/methylation domain-containing protein
MKKAFTLIELIVVIAIIAILAAMLLPVLTKAKDKAKTTQCLNNLKQLNVCLHLYAGDNSDRLVPNSWVWGITDGTTSGGSQLSSSISWCPDNPRSDVTPINIQQGVLWPYNTSVGIYRCPADTSTLDGSSQLRWRSYNMSQGINGAQTQALTDLDIYSYPRFTSVQRPAAKMVWIDENPDTEMDSQFGFATDWDGTIWMDMPSDRHNQGGCLSFVDGHAERWRWVVPKKFQYFGQPVTDADMPDWLRLADAVNVDQ